MEDKIVNGILLTILIPFIIFLGYSCNQEYEKNELEREAYFEEYPYPKTGDIVIHKLTGDTLIVTFVYSDHDARLRNNKYDTFIADRKEFTIIKK